MQVISELVAGIRGAENGQANVYKRATSTPAVVYADYDGSVALAQPLTLDSFGGIECYVNEEVDVRAQDANGIVVRAFSPMHTANSVEYIGSSFSGHRYSDGAAGINQPTTVQAILDGWLTSAGAPDFEVLVGGVAKTLENAFASTSIFINVKAPEYGAVGDGATDDTVAIQAALTAAGVTKGIVLFPSGAYKTTAKLTVPADVSLWGVGAASSAIVLTHATQPLLEYGAVSSTWLQEVRGLTLIVTTAASGSLISMTNAANRKVRLVNSVITGGSAHTGDKISVDGLSSGLLQVEACGLGASATNNKNIIVTTANAQVEVIGSTFVLGGALGIVLNACINGYHVKALGCTFDLSAVTAGAGVGIFLSNAAATQGAFVGNEFLPGAGGTTTGITVGGNFAGTTIFEAGNIFKSGFVANIAGMTSASNNPQFQNLNRDSRVRNITDNSASVDLQGDWYGTVILTRTAAGGAQALTSAVGPTGCELVVIIVNSGFGVIANDPTVNTGGFYAGNPAIGKPSLNKVSVARFRAVYTAGAGAWVETSSARSTLDGGGLKLDGTFDI